MAHAPGEGYIERYSEWAKVLTGARGGEPIKEVSPELLFAITGENDRMEHHLILGQLDWCSIRLPQAGDATHFAQVEVFNPTGSGMMTVVTGAIDEQAAAGQEVFLILDGTASGGGVSSVVPLDTRRAGKGATQVSGGKPDLAIGGQQVIDVAVTPDTGAVGVLTFEIFKRNAVLLAPGHRLKVEGAVVNQNIIVTMWGYERPLTAGEEKSR